MKMVASSLAHLQVRAARSGVVRKHAEHRKREIGARSSFASG